MISLKEGKRLNFCNALQEYLEEYGIPEVSEVALTAMETDSHHDWENFWVGINQLEILTGLMKNLKCPIDKK